MSVLIPMDNYTVLVPDAFPDLVRRRLALAQMQALDDDDYPVIAALWAALADDFDSIGYKVAGGSARRCAEDWAKATAKREALAERLAAQTAADAPALPKGSRGQA